MSDVVGKRYGQKVESSTGFKFYILRPTTYDYILRFARHTQILYVKDMALLMSYTDISPGKRVVEAGTGSGALTAMLASHVKPDGMIYTYEIRPEFHEKAKKNLNRIGLAEYVQFINKDIANGIDEQEVDSVILDLATPWLVIPKIHESLKGGGTFASFSPTIDQVMKTVEALKREGFIRIETVECILRRITVEPGKTRPETLMIGHTGYLTFARNAEKDGLTQESTSPEPESLEVPQIPSS